MHQNILTKIIVTSITVFNVSNSDSARMIIPLVFKNKPSIIHNVFINKLNYTEYICAYIDVGGIFKLHKCPEFIYISYRGKNKMNFNYYMLDTTNIVRVTK